MRAWPLFAGWFQVPAQFPNPACYATAGRATGTGWGGLRAREKGEVKEAMLELTLRRANLIQCSQPRGLVLLHRGEMGMLWTRLSLKRHASNSFNRATVVLMTMQEFRKKAAGVHRVFSELLFKEIRSTLVKRLLMRLAALMFCRTVSAHLLY